MQYIDKIVYVSVGALWWLLEDFPFYVARAVHLDLGTVYASVDGSFRTNFFHFRREKWTRSSRRSSHMENLELFLRAVSGSHSAVRQYGGFGRIPGFFYVKVDLDVPAQFARVIWTLFL